MMLKSNNRRASDSRGQTLIIAIMVMFILAMISAVFIAMVARNLMRSSRSSNVSSVSQIAEAGIRYADMMLTSSEEGADWRPTPDNRGVVAIPIPNPATGVLPVGAAPWTDARDKDPDFRWTRAYWPTELNDTPPKPGLGYAGPSGGFTTYNIGAGRFLLRVSYAPNPKDPLSKFIKIESIGRWGTYLADDPTTWKPAGEVNMRREITAYKPIGITDYLRFYTNKDNKSMDFPLGCTGYKMMYGRSVNSERYEEPGQRGAPIRVNGDLVLYAGWNDESDPTQFPDLTDDKSVMDFYLRGVHPEDASGNVNTSEVIPIDRIEVSGEVKFAGERTTAHLFRTVLGGTDPVEQGPFSILASDIPAFSTRGGFLRDGSDQTDSDRIARGVKRLEPPLVDQPDPTGTTTRYRLLTLDSGSRYRTPDKKWFVRGRFGWGRGVYINNNRDVQPESETLFGGYTLRTDWLKPGFFFGKEGSWKGPYYTPPAVVITLYPDLHLMRNPTGGNAQPDTQCYFTMTRTDTTGNGSRMYWSDPWGRVRPDFGGTIAVPYPDPVNGRTFYKDVYAPNNASASDVRVEGNGVIYAEGNIRIRGMLPKDMQLTVVSNGTIYVDGSLLKYRDRDPNATIMETDPWHGAADSKCALALLARDNICVNTTQFFSPLNSITADNVGSDTQDGGPPYHVTVGNRAESQFKAGFEFGPWESESMDVAQPAAWMLYLRHAGQYGTSYINAWLNPGAAIVGQENLGMLWLNQANSLGGSPFLGVPMFPRYLWGVGDARFNTSNTSGPGIGSSFVGDVFPLTAAFNAYLNSNVGGSNVLQIALDQTTFTRNNYQMGGLAVQPMDIRIEAILYAQEGSFFVIPGSWFNPNPDDPRGGNPARPHNVGGNSMFPYFGDPLDIRVIVDGAVSENMPASIGDVDEWMSRWGKIPATLGSSSVPTAHPGEGLTILYDDHAGWPLVNLNPGAPNAFRTDRFGRPLPFAPRLPVSGSLLYFGDVM